MPRLRQILGLSFVGLTMAGCVPAEQYAAMKLKADQLAEQLGHSQSEIDAANAKASAAQQALAQRGSEGMSRDAMINSQMQQIKDLTDANSDWAKKYEIAMNKVGQSGVPASPDDKGPLPEPVSNELARFAAENPDLVEYIRSRGMVKFKSDVVFAVGDAALNPKAKEVLRRFSAILNGSATQGYELLVAGHTDSTPIKSPSVMKLGHFNNWYLSAHRAISVERELQDDGVSGKRMGVVGYADEQPVQSNTTEAGKAANRRVEVLIMPSTVKSNAIAMATDDEMAAARPTKRKSAPAAPVTAAGRLGENK